MRIVMQTQNNFPVFAFLCTLFFTTSLTGQTLQETEQITCRIIEAVLEDATFQFVDRTSGAVFQSPDQAPADANLSPQSGYTEWRYWNGVLNLAMFEAADALEDHSLSDFPAKQIRFCFDYYPHFQSRYQGENRWNFPFGQLFNMEELDDCGAMGGSLIELVKNDPQERYLQYIEKAANHIMNKQARLKDKTLVRVFPHKWTLWADDLYMGISFLSRMGAWSGDNQYLDDAALQVIQFHKYLFNKEKGMMVHYWYSDKNRQGVAFWGRANGWAMVAQVDLLDHLPEDHPKRELLIHLLENHLTGIARYQSECGLWHQLLDKTDSYLETSCSAMFTYTIARAVNRGYIDPRYASIAREGWKGIMTKIRDDGMVEGVCAGTGTADNLIHYYHRPTPLNDAHGIGAVILAGAEMVRLLKAESDG